MKSTRYSTANNAARAVVKLRADDRCEVAIPGVCQGAVHSIHHREPYGMGGRPGHVDSPAELLAVCGHGTAGCHGHIEANRERARAMGWLATRGTSAVRSVLYRGRPVRLLADGRVAVLRLATGRPRVPTAWDAPPAL